MPQIGELAPGLWLASGFGGHGLNTTAMAGNLIARAIIDGDQTWRQFTPFELVWAGGILGRATAQMYYWTRRLRDAAVERRARAARLAYLRADEAEAAKVEPGPQSVAEQNGSLPDESGSIVPPPAEGATTAEADLPAQS